MLCAVVVPCPPSVPLPCVFSTFLALSVGLGASSLMLSVDGYCCPTPRPTPSAPVQGCSLLSFQGPLPLGQMSNQKQQLSLRTQWAAGKALAFSGLQLLWQTTRSSLCWSRVTKLTAGWLLLQQQLRLSPWLLRGRPRNGKVTGSATRPYRSRHPPSQATKVPWLPQREGTGSALRGHPGAWRSYDAARRFPNPSSLNPPKRGH